MKKSQEPFGNNRGFTLPELIIVIAVMLILSGIGFPAYMNYTYSAKQSEIPDVFDKILLAERMHYINESSLVLVGYNGREPCASSSPSKLKCETTVEDFQNSAVFAALKIVPTGNLYGQYYIQETVVSENGNDSDDDSCENGECGGKDNENSHGGNVGTGNSGNGYGNTGPGNQGNEKPVGNAGGYMSSTVSNISIMSVMDIDADSEISTNYINAQVNPIADSLEKSSDILHTGDER